MQALLSLLILLLLSLPCCSVFNTSDNTKISDAAETTTLWIDHYKLPCMGGENLETCCRIQSKNPQAASEWLLQTTTLFDKIFNWRTSYVVKVVQRKNTHPPADGASFSYQVLEVVKTELFPLKTPFEMVWKTDAKAWLLDRLATAPSFTFDGMNFSVGEELLQQLSGIDPTTPALKLRCQYLSDTQLEIIDVVD